jgi:hypothetical protein
LKSKHAFPTQPTLAIISPSDGSPVRGTGKSPFGNASKMEIGKKTSVQLIQTIHTVLETLKCTCGATKSTVSISTADGDMLIATVIEKLNEIRKNGIARMNERSLCMGMQLIV